MEGSTTLPPGVTYAGQQAPASTPATPATPAATEPAQTPQTSTSSFNDGGKIIVDSGPWNIYKICTGILLLSVGLMAIYYFRERTFATRQDSKEKDKKIVQLNNEVSKIKEAIDIAA